MKLMKVPHVLLFSALTTIIFIALPAFGVASNSDTPIHVAVITGGHGFDEEAFLGLFRGHDDVAFDHLVQEDDSEVFEDISDWKYDVIVFYHMTQKISPQRRANFLQLLEKGVGVVALHHSIAAFQDWPEYEKIIGGRYHLKNKDAKEVEDKASGFKHDVDFTVKLEDHPITEGLKDFRVHDETYINCSFEPDNQPLLKTDDPTSDELIGWARNHRNARICFLQPGHGASIFSDETYRSIVNRAIGWCAGRVDEPAARQAR